MSALRFIKENFDPISAARVLAGLKTRHFGRNLILLKTTDSTQNEAKALVEKGFSEGTTVLAQDQTAGKGRLGRAWASGLGGLWFSIILRPIPETIQFLALVSSLAVAQGIETVVKIKCHLKWPNDVLVETQKGIFQKVSGVLVETSTKSDRLQWGVLGVGINVNNTLPRSLEKIGISLSQISGREIDRTLLFQKALENLEGAYQQLSQRGFESFKNEIPHEIWSQAI